MSYYKTSPKSQSIRKKLKGPWSFTRHRTAKVIMQWVWCMITLHMHWLCSKTGVCERTHVGVELWVLFVQGVILPEASPVERIATCNTLEKRQDCNNGSTQESSIDFLLRLYHVFHTDFVPVKKNNKCQLLLTVNGTCARKYNHKKRLHLLWKLESTNTQYLITHPKTN